MVLHRNIKSILNREERHLKYFIELSLFLIMKSKDRDIIMLGVKEEATRHREALINEYPVSGHPRESLEKDLPPRITFLCYNIFGIGGTVRSVTNLANYLFRRGYPVDIISLRRSSVKPQLGLHPAIRITSLIDSTKKTKKSATWLEKTLARIPSRLVHKQEDLYAGTNLLTDIRLAYRLMKCTSDVVIPTFPSLAKIASRFCRPKTAVIVQEHKFLSAHCEAIQSLIRRVYRRTDGVLTLTDADAKEYSELVNKPTFTIPNGVPKATPDSESPCLRQYKQVVALGRLDPQKQFHLLIEAFARIYERFPDWELSIYGQGSEATRLNTLISDLSLQTKVFLRGVTRTALTVIAESDICAVTSTYEGFGMVFIEAYAAGKPVITFDIERGPKEIVIDKVTGLTAQPFDVGDYAEKLATLMSSAELRDKLGANAKEFFSQRFDIEQTGKRFEHAIATILQGRDMM
jgi:glycosyltransferase involved in cell wall biosynthesis